MEPIKLALDDALEWVDAIKLGRLPERRAVLKGLSLGAIHASSRRPLSSASRPPLGPTLKGSKGSNFRIGYWASPNGHFGQRFIATRHCKQFSFSSSPARHLPTELI